jgi:multidrug efflux pump subunit AcrB
LAGAVIISAFVSLTLTPVLNIRLGGSRIGHSRFYNATEPFFVSLDKGYRSILSYVIKHKWISITIPFVCLIMIFTLLKFLKSELAPLEDHSIIRATITEPEGADFDYTNVLVDRVSQQMIDSIPESRLSFARAGGGGGPSSTNVGGINLFLTEPDQRKTTQQQVYDKLIRIFRRYSEARIIPTQEQTITTSMSGGSQLPVQFVIQNLDFNKLQDVLPKFLDAARKDSIFSNVDVNLKFNKPELNLTVDRLKATNLGVNESDMIIFSGMENNTR